MSRWVNFFPASGVDLVAHRDNPTTIAARNAVVALTLGLCRDDAASCLGTVIRSVPCRASAGVQARVPPIAPRPVEPAGQCHRTTTSTPKSGGRLMDMDLQQHPYDWRKKALQLASQLERAHSAMEDLGAALDDGDEASARL